MKKFTVHVHYQSTVYMAIEADSQEDAQRKAEAKMYSDLPEDLFAEVVHIEEQS